MNKRMLRPEELTVESFPVQPSPGAGLDAVQLRRAPTEGFLCSAQTFNPCCLTGEG